MTQSDLDRIESKLDFIISRLTLLDEQADADEAVALGVNLADYYLEKGKNKRGDKCEKR